MRADRDYVKSESVDNYPLNSGDGYISVASLKKLR
jgi:hypothetical protein